MRIADKGAALLSAHRLSAFDRDASRLWRFRSAPDLIKEAADEWGWSPSEMHDGAAYLFGFYLVGDGNLRPGELVLEAQL